MHIFNMRIQLGQGQNQGMSTRNIYTIFFYFILGWCASSCSSRLNNKWIAIFCQLNINKSSSAFTVPQSMLTCLSWWNRDCTITFTLIKIHLLNINVVVCCSRHVQHWKKKKCKKKKKVFICPQRWNAMFSELHVLLQEPNVRGQGVGENASV